MQVSTIWLHRADTRLAGENRAISEDVLRNAIGATEEGFLNSVRATVGAKPTIVAVGSCCLVGVLWNGTLHIANLGDSRAVSKAIGDAHLKSTEFVLDPSFPRYQLNEPLTRPVLSAEPSISTRVIGPKDKFLIFASDGLWDHVTNQEAAELVHKYPRAGIAKRLIKKALTEAARKNRMTYAELLQRTPPRRQFHDDISVIVLFLDHKLLSKQTSVTELSVRGFTENADASDFSFVDGIEANRS
ncbi:hypothetical protein Scep_003748 [Stephania cephalantha]|uniref:PPM-type phosphatase domain-containing protein n=1 Tax=Stephania cephalantha TaxID=152367 RepID=A0AAP0KSP9_9MAGN